MTEQIKSAIKELKQIPQHIGEDCDGYELRALRLAINSLKAWDEVLNELQNEINLYENNKSIMGGNDFDIEYDGAMKGLGKAIDIIKEKLSEVEDGRS